MRFWLSTALLGILAAGASAQTPEQTAFFESKIRPLLVKNCTSCHGGGQSKGQLSLDTAASWQKGGSSGPVIVPGDPAKSILIQRVKSTGAPMPPNGRLSNDEIAALETWVKMGAPDPRTAPSNGIRLSGITAKARAHWALQPLLNPEPPKVAGVKSNIDAFIRAKLAANGLKPAAPANRATLIRRAYYDLIGMPPTVEEVRAFLADKSPDAWAKVVDGLLASPHYGERWGRHWLDSARYSDTTGLLNGGNKNRFSDFRYANAWTYRDWVVGALNKDLPYDQFLTLQLAADKLPISQSDPTQLAALGFLTVGKRFQDNNDQIDERIDTVTKATLGLTVSCARCHDHPFDPIPTTDYYSMHGIFASIDEPDELPAIKESTDAAQRADYEQKLQELLARGRKEYFDYAAYRQDEFLKSPTVWLQAAQYNPRSREVADLLEGAGLPSSLQNRYLLGSLRGAPNQPVLGPLVRLARANPQQFSRGGPQFWNRILGNRGGQAFNPIIVRELQTAQPKNVAEVAAVYGHIYEKMAPKAKELLEARRDSKTPSGLDAATVQLLEVPFPLPSADTIKSTEQLRELAARFQADPRAAARFPFNEINQLDLTHPGAPACAMIVKDIDEPRDSRVLIRGERARPGDVVPRRFLECLSGPERQNFTEGSGRLELAKAIVSPSNPLTARVAVNRIWMHHFGQGFVRTTDDLGNQSEKPSHPELLDWLAFRFIKDGWSLKKLHRIIMLSETYQQSSDTNPAFEKVDAQNRLLWRANLRRLDFESIRDSMVELTGKLDPTIGGKPVNITDEPYIYRRSIYGYIDRLFLSDLMTQFDVSDPNAPNTGRISTIVPQQALFFMNSPMAVDVARQVASRPEVTTAATEAEKIRATYLILFQRSPRPEEVDLGQQFLAQAAKENLDLPGTPVSALPGRRQVRRPQPRPAQQRGGKYAPIKNNTAMVERAPLEPLELYAQALLCSNEFVYVN
ncbi:MAG: PSD1 and planctomycete cytochrome C domain-containing protein [Armatimonas sp.]